MAQSSLSQALQTYEAELGTSMFIRTTRGVQPTAAGNAFIARAKGILNSYHLVQSEVWDIEELKGGQVEFLLRDKIMIVTTEDHPIMEFARPLLEGDGLWADFFDTADFEYILGPPNTILGRIARQEFQKCGREPIGLNTSISAPFAAAMAMEGLGLALTYRSCIVHRDHVCYLRIGTQGVFLDLGLAYPTSEYRSKAASALGTLFHEMY